MNTPPLMVERLIGDFTHAMPSLSPRDAEKLARAALQTLRLPSESMIQAGYRVMVSLDHATKQNHPENVWIAMVDAAERERGLASYVSP